MITSPDVGWSILTLWLDWSRVEPHITEKKSHQWCDITVFYRSGSSPSARKMADVSRGNPSSTMNHIRIQWEWWNIIPVGHRCWKYRLRKNSLQVQLFHLWKISCIYIYIIGILVETRTFHSPYSGDSPRLPLHFPQKCGPFDSPTVEKLSSARFFELDQFLLHRSQWNRPKLFGLGKLFLSLNHLRWLIIYPILIHAVVGSLTMENQHLQLGHFHFP